MSNPRHLLVIDAIPDIAQFEAVIACFAKITAVFEGHGATDLQRLRTVQQVIGDAEVMATAIFEFPDSVSIDRALASADFSALGETRDQVYKVFSLRICEGH